MALRRDGPVFYVRCLPDGPGGPAPRVEDISARITSLQYDDEETQADKLVLTIDNWDLTLHDDPAFKRGMTLEVSWGYPGRMAPTRSVVVQRIKGFTTLRVEALARSILMNQVGRTRVFRNVRRSDVARAIAREAGFEGESADIEESPQVLPTIAQAGRTDAAFLARLARQEGFQFYVDQDGFHFHQRRLGQPPARVLEYYTSRRGDILSADVENDLTARPGRTRARGRDPLEGTDIDVAADDATDTDRQTLAPIRLVVDPETRETRIEAEAGSEETRPTTATDAAGATREARARFRRVQLAAVKMNMEIVGDPLMLAKTVLELRGMGQRLSGRYYVKKVSHKVGSGGYTCALNLISDGDGGHATSSRAARGLELFESGPATRGRPNTAEPVAGAEEGETQEGAPLESVLVVDQETRATRIEYRDTRPRGGAVTAPRTSTES